MRWPGGVVARALRESLPPGGARLSDWAWSYDPLIRRCAGYCSAVLSCVPRERELRARTGHAEDVGE
jgi:hypothetical protein